MNIEIDCYLHPVSFRHPSPLVALTEQVGRGGCRCKCGQAISIHYKPDVELNSFIGAMNVAAHEAMRENSQQRPFSGHLAFYMIIYRSRPIEHYQSGEKNLGIKQGKDDSLAMSSQHSHKVYESVVRALTGVVFSDVRQIRLHAVKDGIWADEERIRIKIKTVSTGDIDDRFKQLELFDIDCS